MSVKQKLCERFSTLDRSRLLLGAAGIALIGTLSIFGSHKVSTYSNSNELCYSCHIGMDTIVEEYEQSVHFKNRVGVQADCADCHVPKEFVPKMKTKILAMGDVYHMAMGTYNLDNWDENRNRLAQSAYEAIKAVDSSTCKNCHQTEKWNKQQQPHRAALNHDPELWRRQDNTCVDCHKGIAHKRPVVE